MLNFVAVHEGIYIFLGTNILQVSTLHVYNITPRFALYFVHLNTSPKYLGKHYTANILTVLSTAFGSVTFPTVIWLCMFPPKTAIDLKLYSSMSLTVIGTAVGCDNHCQITVGNVTQPMTVNWL